MVFQSKRIFTLFIIGVALTILSSGCSGVSRSINKAVQIREARKQVESLPICPKDSYPLQKVEITPAEFKFDFSSIYIFHAGADLATINMGVTSEKVFEPTLQMLRTKGYTADLAYNIDTNENKKYIECRHCGDLEIENKGFYPFDQKVAEEGCLFIGNDYTSFFKYLINKYPEAEKYQTIAFVTIRTESGSLYPRMLLFDKRKQILVLESLVREIELTDQHHAPVGYRFNMPPGSESEGRLTTAWRGLDKMMSIFPNISGKAIPDKEKKALRKAYIYEYYIGNRPPRVTELKADDTKPTYWTFAYAK